MTDELIAGIALVVGGIVAVPTYRWARNKKSKKRKFIEKAQKAGHCTVGEYESSKVLLGNSKSNDSQLRNDSLEVKYKYTVEGITYYKTLIFQSRGRIGTSFPNHVDVYYDIHNPQKAVCQEEAHPRRQIQTGCLTTIAVTFLTMFITLHLIRALLG